MTRNLKKTGSSIRMVCFIFSVTVCIEHFCRELIMPYAAAL